MNTPWAADWLLVLPLTVVAEMLNAKRGDEVPFADVLGDLLEILTAFADQTLAHWTHVVCLLYV